MESTESSVKVWAKVWANAYFAVRPALCFALPLTEVFQ